MLLAFAQLTIPIIVAGVVIGAIAYKLFKPRGPSTPPLRDPDVTGGAPPPPAPPGKPPEEPNAPPFVKNPNESAVANQLVSGIVSTPGATLADKMVKCTFPVLDGMRVAAGGSAVTRCFRDVNKSQSEVGWITNMAYWLAYPTGPILLKYGSSLYAAAWGRINQKVKSDLASAGLLPGA